MIVDFPKRPEDIKRRERRLSSDDIAAFVEAAKKLMHRDFYVATDGTAYNEAAFYGLLRQHKGRVN